MITPEQLGERYLAVHHRMFRAVNDEMSLCGLSMARTKVLKYLREHGPTRQSVLANTFGLSPHSITDIVDALERSDLVERRPDATDRRAKLVAITQAGEACLGVASATRERLLKQIFGALSEEDRATFLRLLDALDTATKPLIRPAADQAATEVATAPAGTAPAGTAPAETAPAETAPAETAPAEPSPAAARA